MGTILKWAGNKTAIMPELVKHLPAGSRLVEPFAGSCAVMMATDYPSYLVADINDDLINMYQQIKEDPEFFIMIASGFFRQNSEDDFRRIRHGFNNGESNGKVWRAAAFLYLNRHCYRGLCRYNKSGGFNVPYGNYKKPYFPHAEILTFAEKAARATFICATYEETFTMLRSGDVVYCDPPYHETFNQYHSAGFTAREQGTLSALLCDHVNNGGSVVASNSDTTLIRYLYRDFQLHQITARRSMGVVSGEGKSASEIIAVSTPYLWIGFDPAVGRDYTGACE
ncbi:DNA adenine methylase [Buttiauxella ferragutiae]|uniref:DNA adenine methylase n=1 Tax=Buttiauxella ferragutiae TaxID=82989 RepID=UPI001F530249|nr:DNA adenine methylase [Buttiauxella ferragutiae]UNK60800.1 DNA adenine methylase [Buttiauxella ferragutiae]